MTSDQSPCSLIGPLSSRKQSCSSGACSCGRSKAAEVAEVCHSEFHTLQATTQPGNMISSTWPCVVPRILPCSASQQACLCSFASSRNSMMAGCVRNEHAARRLLYFHQKRPEHTGWLPLPSMLSHACHFCMLRLAVSCANFEQASLYSGGQFAQLFKLAARSGTCMVCLCRCVCLNGSVAPCT